MALVKKAGGEVMGAVRYPFPDTTDFSAYLTQAMASGAKTLGLANAGLDTQNCVKQAHEFGLDKKMKIVPLLLFITDVHALGLDLAAGLVTTETFYWDLNDRTRAFTKRVLPTHAEQLSEPGARQRLRDHAALSQGRGGDGRGQCVEEWS